MLVDSNLDIDSSYYSTKKVLLVKKKAKQSINQLKSSLVKLQITSKSYLSQSKPISSIRGRNSLPMKIKLTCLVATSKENPSSSISLMKSTTKY
jgi:hypothetical protein